jgi:hypothetical protein
VLSHVTLIAGIVRTLKAYSPEIAPYLDRFANWMDMDMLARIVCQEVQKKQLFFIQDYEFMEGGPASDFFSSGIPVTTAAMEFWCDGELDSYHPSILLVLAMTDNELRKEAITAFLELEGDIFPEHFFEAIQPCEYQLLSSFLEKHPCSAPWDILPFFISRVFNDTGCNFFDLTYEDLGYSTNPDWSEFDSLVKEFAKVRKNDHQFGLFIDWVNGDKRTRLRQMAEKLGEISVLACDWEGKQNDKNSR